MGIWIWGGIVRRMWGVALEGGFEEGGGDPEAGWGRMELLWRNGIGGCLLLLL
jgi:hypothetical protein